MKASIELKLQVLSERHEEISALLSQAEVLKDANQFRDLSKEYAQLEPVVQCFHAYQENQQALQENQALLSDADPDIRAMAQEEHTELEAKQAELSTELKLLLIPKDPDDEQSVYLEIRAGTGGDEAAIFVGDLFRMYSRFAEAQRWQVGVVSCSEGDHGGFKEIIAKVEGQGVYGQLKFESGAHRVQRVPETESQGRIHTSACTVAIMPVVAEIDEIVISPDQLRIDTYRASGAGGQHVNKTDSAIRITHLPTNTVVECQDERSQHKNRAKAMALLQSRLMAAEREKQQQREADTRRSLVGSGDRSERIRTYNYPQGRVTDHRVNLTLYKLDEILAGDVNPIIQVLRREYQTYQLAALGLSDEK